MLPFDFATLFSIIASCSKDGGLAYSGRIPWDPICIADARYITTVSAFCEDPSLINAVIMDSKMWVRIGQVPLKWRCNVVIESGVNPQGRRLFSSIDKATDNLIFVQSLEEALAVLATKTNIGHVYVLGSHELISDAMVHPRCTKVHLAFVNYTGPTDEYIDFRIFNQLYQQDTMRMQSVRDGIYIVNFATYKRKILSY